MSKSTVSFNCVVFKVQTLVDGGLRVTLDLPENATAAAKLLMDLRGMALLAEVTQIENKLDREPTEIETVVAGLAVT